eukprot:12391-Rhodomonas_salina.4
MMLVAYARTVRCCYAMSGSDRVYAACCLRACYVMFFSDIADGALAASNASSIITYGHPPSILRFRYEMSGTDMLYAAIRFGGTPAPPPVDQVDC